MSTFTSTIVSELVNVNVNVNVDVVVAVAPWAVCPWGVGVRREPAFGRAGLPPPTAPPNHMSQVR